jgi:Terpene cyclase DEP1
MPRTPREALYALLAAAGLCATWYYNLLFIDQAGGTFSVVEFVRGGYANYAASSLSNDLVIGTLTFLAWSFAEARRLDMRHWWLVPVVTFGVAFACAYPLFLLARERRLHASGH